MKPRIKIHAARTAVHATEYKRKGSSERIVASTGEINANSKKDLWAQNIEFLQAAEQGNILTAAQLESKEFTKRNRDLLLAAVNDKEAHRVLGEKIAESLYIVCNRQGFLRKFLARNTVDQGAMPRFPLRTKNVTAVYATSPTQVDSQITRDKWYYPPEFQIVARPFVPENEINQSAQDVLQEKFTEAQEAIMVGEDRLLYNACNAIVNTDNNLSIISSQLTPLTFMNVVVNVSRWGLKTPYALLATDLMRDVIGNNEFQAAIDPVARHELLLTGQIGTMYGCALVTDAYRHPEHKVLNQGEFFIYADALNTGAYSDRDGIKSQPIDISIEKVPGKGWVMWESFAMVVANSRAAAKGIRS